MQSQMNMQGRLNAGMENWDQWDTPAKRLRGSRKARKLTQDQLSAASGVTQSDISKLERGESATTSGWPQLAGALSVDALWLASGKGRPDAAAPTPSDESYLDAPSLGQAIEVLAHALQNMDEIGREMAGTALASIAKRPDQPEGVMAMLSALVEHHTRAPTPGPGSPSPAKGSKKKSAAALRGEGKVVALTLTHGGGQKRQLALPLRTVADPFDTRQASRRELDWYEEVKAAPKANE